MKSNFEKLGETLNQRMQDVYKTRAGISAELGTINGSLGLKVDSLNNAIPKGQYLISTRLKISSADAADLPSGLRNLRSGDRVLVIWCKNEPIVTDILTNS